jgi:predicted aspartyl protease
MKQQQPYAVDYDPPAPVAMLRLGAPDSSATVLLRALIDTGADVTVVPAVVARKLRLPLVDHVTVRGVGGRPFRVGVHAASAEVAGLRCVARVVAFGREPILGRDLLNRLVVRLDGPALRSALGLARKQPPSD